MATYKTPKSSNSGAGYREVPNRPTPQRFVDRKLTGVSPLKQQFEPTDAAPVRLHNKMAGGCD